MMLLIFLVILVNFCNGIELTGSEHPCLRDNHHNMQKHKPLTYIFHPLYFKGTGRGNAHVLAQKETVTITKTIVVEATKHLHKQPVCVKVRPGVPFCHSNLQIQATSVFQTPVQETTKVIGLLEKSKEACYKSLRGRERRHIIPPNHFRHPAREFHIVTELLRITRVEQYVDSMVTATLVAENCIPINEDMQPCPVKEEDYDYSYKPGIEHISIFEKEDEEDKDITLLSTESSIFNSSLLFLK